MTSLGEPLAVNTTELSECNLIRMNKAYIPLFRKARNNKTDRNRSCDEPKFARSKSRRNLARVTRNAPQAHQFGHAVCLMPETGHLSTILPRRQDKRHVRLKNAIRSQKSTKFEPLAGWRCGRVFHYNEIFTSSFYLFVHAILRKQKKKLRTLPSVDACYGEVFLVSEERTTNCFQPNINRDPSH